MRFAGATLPSGTRASLGGGCVIGRSTCLGHRFILLMLFLLPACTWRIQLVPPPPPTVLQDDVARRAINNLNQCISRDVQQCIDAKEAQQTKGE